MWCWRCGYKRYEYTRLKKFIEDRGRCFFCRIDALDKKYGPSLCAKLNRNNNGDYIRPPGRTNWARKTANVKYKVRRFIHV